MARRGRQATWCSACVMMTYSTSAIRSGAGISTTRRAHRSRSRAIRVSRRLSLSRRPVCRHRPRRSATPPARSGPRSRWARSGTAHRTPAPPSNCRTAACGWRGPGHTTIRSTRSARWRSAAAPTSRPISSGMAPTPATVAGRHSGPTRSRAAASPSRIAAALSRISASSGADRTGAARYMTGTAARAPK